MCGSFVVFFIVDLGRSVKCRGVCVYTSNKETEKERSQRKSEWKSGSQRALNALINSLSIDSKCFPRTEDNRTRYRRERKRGSERETFLSVLSSPVLSFPAGTAVSFSYRRALGLQPGMCRVPVARSPPPSSSRDSPQSSLLSGSFFNLFIGCKCRFVVCLQICYFFL